MKKIIGLLYLCLISFVVFMGCAQSPDIPTANPTSTTTTTTTATTTGGSTTTGGGSTTTGGTTTPAAATLKFDFSNAKALASLEKRTTGRAAADGDTLGDFVKILADGTFEDVIKLGARDNLSEISAIYKSPEADSKDVYVLFKTQSTLYDSNNKMITLGRLICVHGDGSIADILKKTDETQTTSYPSYLSLKDNTVTFDSKGNVYFITYDYSTGEVIYQFNVKTNVLTQLVAGVQGTNYSKIQIDKDGQWIFASGNRSSSSTSYFLRAIPISNPNSFVNLYYSSSFGSSVDTNKWTYDDISATLFFIVQDGNNTGLFKATKAGGFANKTFIKGATSTGLENCIPEDLFEYFNSNYETYNWNSSCKTNNEFDANKLITNLLSTTYGLNRNITLSEVDIRFDKYASQTGALKTLAILTAGKKNEEAIQALDTPIGKAAWFAALIMPNNYFAYSSENLGYAHNFLADILYVKNTNILLETSDASYFPKTNGYYNNNGYFSFLSSSGFSSPKNICFEMKKTPTEFLNYLYSFCNVEGQKEFKLTAFQNDSKYSALYSTLKNEAAIQWIAADPEKITLLNEAMGDIVKFRSQYVANPSAYVTTALPYQFNSFIAKTCYISGTDTKAMTWNREESFSISYNSYSSAGKLFTSNDGVYYEYTNLNNSMSSSTTNSPFYYLVQISDAQGNETEVLKRVQLPAGKVVKSLNNQNKIFMQYSLMSNGAELGYHHIYSVDLTSGETKNHFDNVPNRNSLEVISFSTAGEKLYYSAVRGTSVENGIVNIITNEYNPLETQRKMVAVYAL